MRYCISVRRNGVSGGCPGPGVSHSGGSNEVMGWSKGSASRNTKFLRSVSPPRDCIGVAYTFTAPALPSAEAWRLAVRSVTRYLSKMPKCSAFHYVVEFTARGVPHLHLVCYFAVRPSAWAYYMVMVRNFWLSVMPGAVHQAQHFAPVYSAVGWLEYVGKHGSRGLFHYQRASLPESWRDGSSGRMWGYGGDWGECAVARVRLERAGFAAFSRMLRQYMVKVKGRPSSLVVARNEKTLQFPRGFSEWVPAAVQIRFFENLVDRGFSISYVE